MVFEPPPMRDVYFDFQLPGPGKIAAGVLTPSGKWWPFEILPYFHRKLQNLPFSPSNRIVSSQKNKKTKIN
jgi:hypothetical protein